MSISQDQINTYVEAYKESLKETEGQPPLMRQRKAREFAGEIVPEIRAIQQKVVTARFARSNSISQEEREVNYLLTGLLRSINKKYGSTIERTPKKERKMGRPPKQKLVSEQQPVQEQTSTNNWNPLVNWFRKNNDLLATWDELCFFGGFTPSQLTKWFGELEANGITVKQYKDSYGYEVVRRQDPEKIKQLRDMERRMEKMMKEMEQLRTEMDAPVPARNKKKNGK